MLKVTEEKLQEICGRIDDYKAPALDAIPNKTNS